MPSWPRSSDRGLESLFFASRSAAATTSRRYRAGKRPHAEPGAGHALALRGGAGQALGDDGGRRAGESGAAIEWSERSGEVSARQGEADGVNSLQAAWTAHPFEVC